MKIIIFFARLLACTFLSAAAASERPLGFPFDRKFVVISLNGEDFGAKSPTLIISREADKFSGKGSMFCNNWDGEIKLSQKGFRVTTLLMTAMRCRKNDSMKMDDKFLDALSTVKQWRMEGSLLILEGGLVTLTLSSTITPR